MGALTDAVPALMVKRHSKVAIFGYRALNYRDDAQEQAANTDHRGMFLFQQDPNALGQGSGAFRVFLQQFVRTGTT